MSLRIAPESSNHALIDSIRLGTAAPSAPALQDILRTQQGPLSIASQLNNRHPLEGRISNWEETQHASKMEQYRRIFGAGVPIKRTMELLIVENTDFKPSVLGGSSNLHRDILLGKDTSLDWEDVYTGSMGDTIGGFHSEMERKVGL